MAKVVNPINPTHTIAFVPRFDSASPFLLHLTNEATGVEQAVAVNSDSILKNDIKTITFDFTFTEKQKFQIRLNQDSEIVYRGLLIATEQDPQNYKPDEGFLTY